MIEITDKSRNITVVGKTQRECAEKLGYDSSYICRFKGKRFIVSGLREITTKRSKNQNKVFTQRFRQKIKDLDWTQKDFARESGLSIQYVEKLASGVSIPRANSIVDICLTLDVSADYLLGLTDNERIC